MSVEKNEDGLDVYTMTQGWALKATTSEIAGEHVRMAAVSAGDGDPGWHGEAFEIAVKFYGPSIIAHTLTLLKELGMSSRDAIATAKKELRDLES